VVVALTAVASDALAEDPTKEQCIAANQDAQALRRTGKIVEAREQLFVCIAKACPGALRDDCAERLNDVEKAVPTIVFIAKDEKGADLSAVRVTMDGAALADHLDGSALSVNPGEHTFELMTDGFPAITRKLLIREGAKGRQEVFAFGSAAPPPPVPAVSSPAPTTTPSETSEERSETTGNGQRTIAYVVGGAGIVGLGLGTYFGLRAKSTYDDARTHCPTGPSTCDGAGVTGGDDAHNQATVSTVAFVAGGVLLAGGVVLFLTAPKRGALAIQPTAGLGGIRLTGTW
jgi:hypothetical protein